MQLVHNLLTQTALSCLSANPPGLNHREAKKGYAGNNNGEKQYRPSARPDGQAEQ